MPADCQMSVFKLSRLVDRKYDHMFIHNINLSGYMDRLYCYIPFYSQALLAYYR